MRSSIAILAALAAAACSGPPTEPWPPRSEPPPLAPTPPQPPAPDSAEAAQAVARTYYALVESGRLAQAAALRVDGQEEDVRPFRTLHAEVGAPRTVSLGLVAAPVVLYGRYATGGDYRAYGKITLRRADGPGGWRILRIETVSGARPTG